MNEYTSEHDNTVAKFIKNHSELRITYSFSRYVECTYTVYGATHTITKNEYKCTLRMKKRQATFNFISNSEPTKYDLLCCLSLDCSSVEYNSLKEFIEQFGYSWDDIGAKKGENEAFSRDPKEIYKACIQAARKLKNLFGEDLFDVFVNMVDDGLENLTEDENACIEV